MTAGLASLPLAAIPPLPGIIGTLVLVAIVVLVGRVLLKVAWKIVLVALVVAVILWFLGLLGPLGAMF